MGEHQLDGTRASQAPENTGCLFGKRPLETADPDQTQAKRTRPVCIPPPLPHPKSLYTGYRHALQREKERDILQDFLSRNPRGDESFEDCIFFELEDFCVYHPFDRRRCDSEMVSLNALNIKRSAACFLVDGVLNDGTERRYMEAVSINTLSIEHTDFEDAQGNPRIWVQSVYNSERNDQVWYTLSWPSAQYTRYHQPFLWLVVFAKHFLQFADHMVRLKGDLVLQDFRAQFDEWLNRKFPDRASCWRWRTEYGSSDFRNAVSTHRDWLWDQVHGIDDILPEIRKATVWNEILHLTAIPPAKGDCIEETVVTPYVYGCFAQLFGMKLKMVAPKDHLVEQYRQTWCSDSPARKGPRESKPHTPAMPKGLSRPTHPHWRDLDGGRVPFRYTDPKIGDVVAFEKDQRTKWKSIDTDNFWFGYVTNVYPSPGRIRLAIVWLYRPEDTILYSPGGKYPHDNELFFSDHCNCGSNVIPLLTSDVRGLLSVEFFGDPKTTTADYAIRMKYETGDPGFLSLKDSDLAICPCNRVTRERESYETVKERYRCGDTILVELPGHILLEPAIVVGFEDSTSGVTIRRLYRRGQLHEAITNQPESTDYPANELVFTDTYATLRPDSIVRECQIRVFLPGQPVSTPYDREGRADFFFITHQYLAGIVMPMESLPPRCQFRQGFDPYDDDPPRRPLRGLDLFCGGGNFGRGLEEGGAVKMHWAVDIESAPLHTYRANLRDVNDTELYLGSINNYLQDAIQGKFNQTIAEPGEVEFISAGSPCQGFSLANNQKHSEKSLQNCSLVSSLATAIDIYRPKYALLENVHQIATLRKSGDLEYNVFSTMLCCLVGMGYQCQQFILDSWSFGDPQSRTRLFLAVSAPGEKALGRPSRSHTHPNSQKQLGLYRAPNGEQFGFRDMVGACPFRVPRVRESFDRLPNIHDDKVGICVPFPDHRCSRDQSDATRRLLTYIPIYPSNQGWRAGVVSGKLTRNLRVYEVQGEKAHEESNSWKRINGDGLCRTITTTLTPQCSRTGTWVHYEQPRLLTMHEARIAQGFPDSEVLVGDAARRFKIIGNSVARGVSLAMGLALRSAYFGRND